jgi:hypothetical protein
MLYIEYRNEGPGGGGREGRKIVKGKSKDESKNKFLHAT